MNKNFEILNKTDKVILVHHKCTPSFNVEMHQETKEVSGLKVFSNGYLTKELNVLLDEAKQFIDKIFS